MTNDASTAVIKNFAKAGSGVLEESEFNAYKVDIDLEGGDKKLVATVQADDPTPAPTPAPTPDPTPKEYKENRKSPVETQAAGITLMTQGGDLMAGDSLNAAAAAVEANAGVVNVLTPFSVIGGSNARIKSGSHVNVKSWMLNAGLSKEIKNSCGKLLIGPVIEYGRGKYDSYLDNGMHGKGHTQFIGVGLIGKQTFENQIYTEGSLRLGRVSNYYKADSVYQSSYDIDATYYAAHMGVGKIIDLSPVSSLDVYGKLFFTHQNGASSALAGYSLSLDPVNSFRTKVGVRYNYKLGAKNTVYAGAAWQDEFAGKMKASYKGEATPVPSVKGNTGFVELGWKIQPGSSDSFEMDLGVSGFAGVQRGVSGKMLFNWKF